MKHFLIITFFILSFTHIFANEIQSTFNGTIHYSEPMAMHPDALLRITLKVYVTQDSNTFETQTKTLPISSEEEIPFTFKYNISNTHSSARYNLSVEVRSYEETLIWQTKQNALLLSKDDITKPLVLTLNPVGNTAAKYWVTPGEDMMFQCEKQVFHLKAGVGGEVALLLKKETHILSIEHVPSSSKYTDGNGTLFWFKGDSADFRVAQRYYAECKSVTDY